MKRRYQEVYPSPPLERSTDAVGPSAARMLTLEYFEAEPGEMPTATYAQHHILLNLREAPTRVENWRNGEHRDFEFRPFEVVVTPAGIESGWRWHERSKVIVITIEPEALARFAIYELGVVLESEQLANIPQFEDRDLCAAGELLLDALRNRELGSMLMYESLARVFLIKLVQRYGERRDFEEAADFTAQHFRAVLDHVQLHYASDLSVGDLAQVAGLSADRFARLFKRTLGETPHQFVLSYRVERAQEFLRDPHAGLAEIASDCGFSDQSHFTRTFKARTGVTPGVWRGRLAEDDGA